MDYADLLKRAHEAAKAAILAEVARLPEDMNAFDCGYAWVVLKPARGPFVTFCRQQIKVATNSAAPGLALTRSVSHAEKEFGAVRDYGGGGWQWWMPGRDVFNGQSVRMFEKGAQAFAAVLVEAGLNAHGQHEARLMTIKSPTQPFCRSCGRELLQIVPFIPQLGPPWHWDLTHDPDERAAQEQAFIAVDTRADRWPSLKRTDAEIVARLSTDDPADFFGFGSGDLLGYLPFDLAKPFLKDGTTPQAWAEAQADTKDPKAQIIEYLLFAWDKANNCRGLSAARSICHMRAWLWAAGEDELLKLPGLRDGEYDLYGKAQLREISIHFGVDWEVLDNGRWTNDEGQPGVPADAVPRLVKAEG